MVTFRKRNGLIIHLLGKVNIERNAKWSEGPQSIMLVIRLWLVVLWDRMRLGVGRVPWRAARIPDLPYRKTGIIFPSISNHHLNFVSTKPLYYTASYIFRFGDSDSAIVAAQTSKRLHWLWMLRPEGGSHCKAFRTVTPRFTWACPAYPPPNSHSQFKLKMPSDGFHPFGGKVSKRFRDSVRAFITHRLYRHFYRSPDFMCLICG